MGQIVYFVIGVVASFFIANYFRKQIKEAMANGAEPCVFVFMVMAIIIWPLVGLFAGYHYVVYRDDNKK